MASIGVLKKNGHVLIKDSIEPTIEKESMQIYTNDRYKNLRKTSYIINELEKIGLSLVWKEEIKRIRTDSDSSNFIKLLKRLQKQSARGESKLSKKSGLLLGKKEEHKQTTMLFKKVV